MNPISLAVLQIGKMTEREYYSIDGEMLIAKGVTFSQQHFDTLQRRKIDTIYMKDDEDSELNKILNADFRSFTELGIDDSLENHEADFCGGLNNPELAGIKTGKDGLEQLMTSRKVLAIDASLQEQAHADVPTGIALKSRSAEKKASERTDEYKTSMVSSYEESVDRVKFILMKLAEGESVSNENIRFVVNRFIEIYLNDKNLLLNLATIKPSEQDYIFNHSLNVCILSINIAAAAGYSEQQVLEIGIGGLVHDVGMLLIPKKIRMKKGRLEESEWFDIQKHPMLGLHLLEKIDRLPSAVPFIAYQTHERENGKGYPKQRSSRLIHNYAKVVAVADIYEAFSSPRIYREGNIPYKAMEMLIKMAKQGLLNGDYVKAFLEYSSLFPVGSIVELSNGCLARVIKANGTSFAKPVVYVYIDAGGARLPKDQAFELDLAKSTNIQIVKAHSSMMRDDVMMGF
jgi:HD-GYP domain-containing protein (c-di-GMP phosphodiesterase class II)